MSHLRFVSGVGQYGVVLFIVGALVLLTTPPLPVEAVICDLGYEEMAGVCVPTSDHVGLSDREPGQVVVTVMNWLMSILGILAIVALVVAGIMYLGAAGDEKRTDTAKKIIMYTIIGVAVALLAYVIVMTVEQLVTGGEGELDPY